MSYTKNTIAKNKAIEEVQEIWEKTHRGQVNKDQEEAMLLNDIAKLNILEIEEKIVTTEGEERLFYVNLYNKVLEIRRKETLLKAKDKALKGDR